MAENKVRFGLKNVYYSVLTEGATNTWATPVAVPGAVSLDLSASVASEDFYADNVTYFRTFANNGYEGTLEMARITDKMLEDVWGMTAGTDKVLREKTGVQPKPFALLFQIEGDQKSELNVLYRCIPSSKPTAGSQTTEDTASPVTQSFDFSALPLVTGTEAQLGLVKARTTDETADSIRASWFTAVNVPE